MVSTMLPFQSFMLLQRFLLAALVLGLLVQPAQAQVQVFSRSEVATGLWWDTAALPWFNSGGASSGNNARPDNPTATTANFIQIGHNNNTTMSVNGAFFRIGSLDIAPTASSNRIYNTTAGGGWSFRTDNSGFTNRSTATQTINVPVGLDTNTVVFRANALSTNNFTTNFFLNNNTASFGGTEANSLFILSGTVQQGTGTDGKILKVDNNTLRLTASNSYQGTTTLSNGVLQGGNNNAFGTGTLALNGGTIASDSSTARTFANALTIGGNVTFGQTSGGTGALTFSSSATNNLGGGTRTLTANVATTLGGAIGNGNLTKAGDAVLTLSNASSSFGTLTINAGSVTVVTNATVTSLAGSGGLNLAGGGLTINTASSTTFSGAMTGSGVLVKAGVGTTTLTVTNARTGGTVITNGTLALNTSLGSSSALGSGTVTVASAGTLAGSGSILGHTTVSGRVAPGSSPGLLDFKGNLTFLAASQVVMEISATGVRGLNYDAVNVGGSLSIDPTATLSIVLIDGYTPVWGDSFDLFDYGSGGVSGEFLVDTSLPGGLNWDTSNLYTTGVITVVPEPATAALALLGIGLIAWRIRARRG